MLQRFYKERPVLELVPLLQSTNPTLLSVGAWICSELGDRNVPLIKYLLPLLKSERPLVRHEVADALACSLSWRDKAGWFQLALLLDDPHSGVRSAPMTYFANIDRHRIWSARSWALEHAPASSHEQGLGRLLVADDPTDLIQSENPTLRRYGAILAARLYMASPSLVGHFLKGLVNHSDEELRKYAIGMLPG